VEEVRLDAFGGGAKKKLLGEVRVHSVLKLLVEDRCR